MKFIRSLGAALLFPLAVLFALVGCGRRQTAVEAGTRAQILHRGVGGASNDPDPQLVALQRQFRTLEAGVGLRAEARVEPHASARRPGASFADHTVDQERRVLRVRAGEKDDLGGTAAKVTEDPG